MRDRILHPLRPSDGERSLLLAWACVGILGAVISYVIVSKTGARGDLVRSWRIADYWFVVSGAIGAVGGLLIGRKWLGGPGVLGTVRALMGIIVVSFLAALIAGTLVLPLYGTMFGPMIFALTMMANPVLALIWAYALILAHLLIREWRSEKVRIRMRSDRWR